MMSSLRWIEDACLPVEATRALLAECGVPAERVRVELFGGPPATIEGV